jgi:hypothetical protein
MDTSLLTALLSENESSTLDFKREQYLFSGADDNAKSEILKDLLAFANAWRRTDAFILVGVEETPTGGQVVGVKAHPDDAQLQQFVTSKTSRPLMFSYEVVLHEGVEIGVYRIPVQPRPVFLTRDFGKLRQNTVYLRRGSSTDVAKPDEVARMGAADTAPSRPAPALDLGFIDPLNGRELGRAIRVTSSVLEKLSANQLPTVRQSPYGIGFKNPTYFIDLVEYVAERALLRPVRLAITNRSSVSADDTVVEIIGNDESAVEVATEAELLERPRYEGFVSLAEQLARNSDPAPKLQIERMANRWKLTAAFGRVRPQSTVTCNENLYIGATSPAALDLEAVVFGHDLEPTRIQLKVDVTTQERSMELTDIAPFIEEDVRD